MNILIAPDKFKGSLRAEEVCHAIAEGLRAVSSHIQVRSLPLADGGEGTCELLTGISGGEMITVEVRDPLSRPIRAAYGLSPDGATAFIEMAKASGLGLLDHDERNPTKTSTVGTGDLIRDALDRNVNHIILGIGGSATNDGGMGAADTLGIAFYDNEANRLQPVGGNLERIHEVKRDGVHARLKDVHITILCDVDNPLFGENGAAYVFARQKGADDAMIVALDNGLRHFSNVMESVFHKSANFPGAGAAGGIAVALSMLGNVEIRRGMDFIAAFTGLEKAVNNADLVITGEGKIDQQTLSGKVVSAVAGAAKRLRKPVIAFAGRCDLTADELRDLGIARVITLAGKGVQEKEAMTNAFSLLKSLAATELKNHINH